MTQDQVIALAIISVFIVGLFAYAYWIGRRDGYVRGQIATRNQNHQTIHALEASLDFLRKDHEHLAQRAKKLRETNGLQELRHQTLLRITEKLRIAAETWSAFKTGKKLERNARTLRGEALAMAELLKPTDQEAAA
ncbi:hypothetical protein [Pseudomonas palmensis]